MVGSTESRIYYELELLLATAAATCGCRGNGSALVGFVGRRNVEGLGRDGLVHRLDLLDIGQQLVVSLGGVEAGLARSDQYATSRTLGEGRGAEIHLQHNGIS